MDYVELYLHACCVCGWFLVWMSHFPVVEKGQHLWQLESSRWCYQKRKKIYQRLRWRFIFALFSLPYSKVPTSWYEIKIKSKVTHTVLSRQFLWNRLNIFHISYMVAVKSEDWKHKKGQDSGTRLPRFESWYCYFLPEWIFRV